MRQALLLFALSGCDLYFATDSSPSALDAPPPESPGECQFYQCRVDTVYKFDPVPVNPNGSGCGPINFSTAQAIETCEYGCRHQSLYQGGPVGPCAPAPPKIYACAETGACVANQTQTCSAPMQCGVTVSTGSCTCDTNGWSCHPACSDGLCRTEDVQQAIVGTWTGTVTTPFDFMPSYETTLTIAPNGDWSATGDPFYYGGNGGTTGSQIFVQAQTDVGAYGVVRLFLASVDGQLSAIRVDATRLRFTFTDSWLSCGRSFQFDLVRAN
jgi:hypothetical protein